VLFSEPKIPQWSTGNRWCTAIRWRFSALQRAENSSIPTFTAPSMTAILRFSALQRAENSSIPSIRRRTADQERVSVLFSEPKIPQSTTGAVSSLLSTVGFSALQRAENSSIPSGSVPAAGAEGFQCSSASRKFLNSALLPHLTQLVAGFSALQRAENSSIQSR